MSSEDLGDVLSVEEWPDDFDEAAAEALAASDHDDIGVLEEAGGEDLAVLATGIISHQLRCALRSGNRYFVNDNSSFRVPHTDEYLVRVALYNRQGQRVYLGPFRNKGTATGYHTLLHTEAVWDDSRITHRALVLWRAVNGGSVWNNWKHCG